MKKNEIVKQIATKVLDCIEKHGDLDNHSTQTLIAQLFKNNSAPCEVNAKRIVSCVNAMAGIENPEEFVKRAREAGVV